MTAVWRNIFRRGRGDHGRASGHERFGCAVGRRVHPHGSALHGRRAAVVIEHVFCHRPRGLRGAGTSAARRRSVPHLGAAHYREMKERLDGDGLPVGPFNPCIQRLHPGLADRWLVDHVVRTEAGEAGGSQQRLRDRRHAQLELIAQDRHDFPSAKITEIRRRQKAGPLRLEDLRARWRQAREHHSRDGPRVAKIWQRMGFRPVSAGHDVLFLRCQHVLGPLPPRQIRSRPRRPPRRPMSARQLRTPTSATSIRSRPMGR